jgi:hypothetical protein
MITQTRVKQQLRSSIDRERTYCITVSMSKVGSLSYLYHTIQLTSLKFVNMHTSLFCPFFRTMSISPESLCLAYSLRAGVHIQYLLTLGESKY